MIDLGGLFDTMAAKGRHSGSGRESNHLCGCGALIDECAVRPDGWITPCDRIAGLKAGHIRDKDFRRIWQSSEVFRRFRRRREMSLSELKECRECDYTAFCTGGCAAVPYALYGEELTRDPLACYRIYSGEEQFYMP
jgi:radical SAM protein with 4Fe4S-binding SPASM domain